MSIYSTEAQASGESEISRSPRNDPNLPPHIHESPARTHSPTLSHLLFKSMSTPRTPLAGGNTIPVKPTFQPLDQDSPTRDELVTYAAQVDTFRLGIRFTLSFLLVDKATWPPGPDTTISTNLTQVYAIWRKANEIGEATARIESFLKDAQISITQCEKEQLCQNSVGVTPSPSNGIKTPMPSKFSGKKGDPAFTFIAACNNYRVMKPGAFPTDAMCVRWALQQMEDKAGPWSNRQLKRMDEELDDQGRPPKELRKWKDFGEFFLTQYGDPSLVEKARVKWKNGLSQTGKAVDYFEEVEATILRLNYPRDSEMTMDQVIAGLKTHIRTHFIGKSWATLNEMKAEVIPYDAAHWEINSIKSSNERARTQASSGSKSGPTQERGKSQTPYIKTEVSKVSGSQRRFLPQEEFDYCKKNRLCFMCKADGLEIVGSAKFHPNHLPQKTDTKNEEKKGKIAATEGFDNSIDDTDSDSDNKNSKN